MTSVEKHPSISTQLGHAVGQKRGSMAGKEEREQ